MLLKFLTILFINIYLIIAINFDENILTKESTDKKNIKDEIFLRTRDLFKGSQLIQVGQREPYTAFITKITLPKYHCIDKLKLKTSTILTGAEDIEIVFEDCNGRWKLIHYSNLKNQFDFLKKIYVKTFAILSSKSIADVTEVFVGLCDNNEDIYNNNEYKKDCQVRKKNNKHKIKKRSKRFLQNMESSINVIFLNEQQNENNQLFNSINSTQKEILKRQVNKNVIETCEPGWYGENCNIADCSGKKNCSGAGYCVKPNECRCILNHYGDDCSLCQGPYCSHCDYHCVHGKCDIVTKTCQCSNFWGGSACDVCLDKKKCLTEPKLLMLLPQSGPILKQNTFVFAHGTDFPKADSYRYSCIFGGIATEGRWLSSNLIRCMVPPVSHVGKHLFNLIPLNSNIKIQYLENRPIHYTFYVDCNPNICQGSCMGPKCICGNDRNGLQCEDINAMSNEIYNQTKVNEELANAFEGVPYRVNVPINSDSTLISLMSEAINYGLRFDVFKGQLVWENPIGRKEPYEINVVMNHGFIRYSLKWILNVKPSYDGRIISINSPDINDIIVKGFIKFYLNTKPFQAPLLISIFSSDKQSSDTFIEIVKIKSSQNGTFVKNLVPYALPTENYSLCLTHPGVIDINNGIFCEKSNGYSEGVWSISKIIINHSSSLKCIKNENKTLSNMIKGIYKIKSINFDCANSWEFDILFPREKISVRKLEFKDDGNTLMAEFILKNNQCLEKKFNFIGLIFCPNSRMSSVVRQTIECQEIGYLRTEPEKLIIVVNPITNFTESFSLKIYVSDETKRNDLLQNILSDSSIVKPFSIISLDENDDYIEIELLNESIENITNSNGNLYLPNIENPIVKVPYFIKFSITTSINFNIYLKSLLKDNLKDNNEIIATINIKSPSRNISIIRGSKMNEIVEFNNFAPGTYSISIIAYGYNDYYNILTINENIKMLTVFLEPEFPYKPIISNNEYSMEKIQTYLKNVPLVSVTPSSLTLEGNEKLFKKYIELHYEEGIESTFVTFNDIDKIYEMITLNGNIYKIEVNSLNNTSLCLGCKIKVLLTITLQDITFDKAYDIEKGKIIKLDYFVLIRSINWNYKGYSDLLIINKNSDQKLNLPSMNKYHIMCNCYVSTLQNCLKDYQSVLGCSKSWDRIPDEIISIHTFANFILLKADCERNGIQMKKVKKLLECLNDMEEMCPRVKNKNNNLGMHESFPQQLKNTFLSSFPNIKSLELQLSEIPILFNHFFNQLDILIPDNEISQITDLGWFNNFIKFASDYSHGSNEITDQELLRFPNWYQGKSLIFRWNTMKKDLEGEKDLMFNLMPNSTIFAFKDLVEKSDKLKTISRQFNQDTPFSMLNEVLYTLFSNVEATTSLVPSILDNSCKFNDVYIKNSMDKVFENESFKVILYIKSNTKMKLTISDVKLNLEMKKMDDYDINIQFRIIPNFNKYFSGDKMTIVEWVITPMIMRRLTNEIKFKPVVMLKFKHPISEDILEQQLSSQVVSIIPMEFVRIYWFSYPYVINEKSKNPSRSYSALLSIMNAGYTELKNIELNNIKAYIISDDFNKRIPFKIVKNNSLMKIPQLLSGESVQIPFDFYLENADQGILTNLSLQLTTSGRFPAHIQSKSFNILQQINDKKLIIYENDFSLPIIYYDIERSRMTPIQEVSVEISKNGTINIERNKLKYLILNVQKKINQNRESRFGPLFIQLNISSILNDVPDQIQQISTLSNGQLRQIDNDNIWFNSEKLNFVDLENKSTNEKLQYIIVFGNKKLNLNSSKVFDAFGSFQNTSKNINNKSNTISTDKKYTTSPVSIETLFPKEKANTQKVNFGKEYNDITSLPNKGTSKTVIPGKMLTTNFYYNTSTYTKIPKIISTETVSKSTPYLPRELNEMEINLINKKENISSIDVKNSSTKNTTGTLNKNFYFSTLPSSNPLNEIISSKVTKAPNQNKETLTSIKNLNENENIYSKNNGFDKKPSTKFSSLENSTNNQSPFKFIPTYEVNSPEKPLLSLSTKKPIKELEFYEHFTTTNSYFISLANNRNDTIKNTSGSLSPNKSTTILTFPENGLHPIGQLLKDSTNGKSSKKYKTNTKAETLFPSKAMITSTKSLDVFGTTVSPENNFAFKNSTHKSSIVTSIKDAIPLSSTTTTNEYFNTSNFVFTPFEKTKSGDPNGVFTKDYFKNVAYKIQNNPRETIQMACNNRKSNPIWQIICDLDKIFEIESNL